MKKVFRKFILTVPLVFSTLVLLHAQNAPTSFSGTATGTTITLTWNPENADPNNAGYIIRARRTPGGAFPTMPGFGDLPISNDNDLTDGAGIIQIPDEDIADYSGFINIATGAQYDFEIFTYDNNSISSSASTTVYTLATDPGAFPGVFTFTATAAATQIDLAFTKASLLPMNAHGYLVLRRAANNPSLGGISDGNAPGGTYFLATITDSTATSYIDNTALGGITYHYALVPFRVGFNGATPINQTYNYGSLSTFQTATIPLETTIDEITGGIAASPLGSSSTEQAILGFSIISNGAPNFTAINIQVTSSALNKFSNAYLYQSTNNTFGPADTPVGSVTDNLTGTEIQLSGFSVALSSSPQYFFIVVDVQDTVSASSPTLTPSFTNANISISGGGTIIVNGSPLTGTTYSFADTSPPEVSSLTPPNNATNISVLLNTFTVVFNEPVVFIGNSSTDLSRRIVLYDDDSNVNRDTIEVADINVAGNTVTFTTTFSLQDDENYDIIIGNNVFEDAAGNNFAGLAEDSWDFDTELAPNISSLSGTTRCVNDVLTINGQRFTGTGGSGNTKPIVRINGFQVPPVNITVFSSTSITLTVPPGASTGNVVVENVDNGLTSNNSALTVHPAMITNLTVNPETLSPAQNTSVDVDILGTQSNYNYWLIANSTPGGYTPTTQNTAGGGNITLTTTPALSQIGDYTYRIEVRRTGCTTRTLDQTPFTLTVASLAVSVNATDVSVCDGENTILIASTSGGTGFYQFSWSGPNGFSSSSSSPEVTMNLTPTNETGWYVCTLTDNSANVAKDSVFITVNPVPTASFDPAPGETVVRTKYTVENRDYRLYGSPVGGVFSGQGVKLKNDGFYYFNPFDANTGNHPITYTFTNVQGCSAQDSETFEVTNTAINNLDVSYCRSTTSDGPLSPNSSFPTYHPTTNPSGWQFTRLVFYRQLRNSPFTYCIADTAPIFPNCGLPNPLTVNSTISVQDISQLPGVMFNQPVSYTLNLDVIRNNYGYSSDNYFYILAYGRNTSGVETYVTFQYFDVFDNGPVPSIAGINENQNICSDFPTITLQASEPGYTVNNFSITPGGFSASLSGTNNRDFNPGHPDFFSGTIPDERPLRITMAYSDFNNCPNTTVRNFNWVKKPLGPIAPDVEYCKILSPPGGQFTINASPNGSGTNPYWYELDPVLNPSTPILDSINFQGFVAPGIDGLTSLSKDFYVTQNFKGCEGAVTIVTLTINEAPDAEITTSIDAPICADRTFILYGPEESPGVAYPKYVWTFGDGTTIEVLNDSSVSYQYPPGNGGVPRTISLTVTNSNNCQNVDTYATTVGINPIPEFSYSLICDGDVTEFNASSTNITVSEYSWDFGDGTIIQRDTLSEPAPEGGTIEDPHHQYLSPGEYPVTVTAFAPTGCFDSVQRTLTVLEYLTFTTDNPYDMGALDGGRGFWTVEDIAGNTTWEFATPSTPIMGGHFNSAAWVTNASGPYEAAENSYLNSPCFDIFNIDRPVITLDFVLNTESNRDGVVLEYSEDGGITWQSLGGVNSGINWFNTTGFFTGNIGNSPIGWSDNSFDLEDNPSSDTLAQGRKALDNIPGLTRLDRQKLRLRFAFRTDNNRELEGFAFNNLKIETRNRIILLENFTNENDPAYIANNTKFINNFDNAISSDEAVKLQYHVGFPQPDGHYAINTADPSARAAFYGIPLTDQYIPSGFIDGKTGGNFTNTGWVLNEYGRRSLKVSPYELTVSSLPSTDPTYLKFNVDVTALTRIFAFQRPVLHIALVEKKPDANNDFVLRKMIPDAAGLKLPAPMDQGESANFIDSVRLDNPTINLDSIAIIAFIQDELPPREVYQAAIDLNPTNLPDQNLITGIEDKDFGNKISIYPNPANREVNVVLPERTLTPIVLNLMDAHGRTVHTNGFATGEQQKTLDTSELTSGLYILQFNTQQGVVRKKVMVVHEK